MAKRQTRRSVSLSRATYDAIMESSRAAGISASEWLTQLVRVQCPQLPPQIHARAAVESVRESVPRVPVVPPPRRADLDAYAAKRVIRERSEGIAPGALCAVCVDAKATHREQLDKDGPHYAICDGCSPADDRIEDGRGRWKRRTA